MCEKKRKQVRKSLILFQQNSPSDVNTNVSAMKANVPKKFPTRSYRVALDHMIDHPLPLTHRTCTCKLRFGCV